MKKLLTVLLLGLLFLSCGKKEEEKAPKENGKTEAAVENKETIVASTAPLKWLVEKIAGEDYNVIAIVPPNANHELFEPKPDDLKKLENSKLFFTYNLLGFEKKISESLNNSDKVVNVLSSADPAFKTVFHI
jgi:zinc ABC transporter, zinc-binding protein